MWMEQNIPRKLHRCSHISLLTLYISPTNMHSLLYSLYNNTWKKLGVIQFLQDKRIGPSTSAFFLIDENNIFMEKALLSLQSSYGECIVSFTTIQNAMLLNSLSGRLNQHISLVKVSQQRAKLMKLQELCKSCKRWECFSPWAWNQFFPLPHTKLTKNHLYWNLQWSPLIWFSLLPQETSSFLCIAIRLVVSFRCRHCELWTAVRLTII